MENLEIRETRGQTVQRVPPDAWEMMVKGGRLDSLEPMERREIEVLLVSMASQDRPDRPELLAWRASEDAQVWRDPRVTTELKDLKESRACREKRETRVNQVRTAWMGPTERMVPREKLAFPELSV